MTPRRTALRGRRAEHRGEEWSPGQGLGLAGAGMLLGLPLAWVMYRLVASALDLFQARMGLGYVIGVTLALGTVAVLSTYLPARRASAVPPGLALRE